MKNKMIKFLSYPAYYDPRSSRAVDYLMRHFYSIRSLTRPRRILKHLVRPIIPILSRRDRTRLEESPNYNRIRPYLAGTTIEVVIDALRFYRLIDFDRRVVINVLKEDGLSDYFQNEVAARQKLSKFSFIPKLLEVDGSKKIFIDEYVCERPLKSGSLRDLDPEKIAARIKEMLRQTSSVCPVRPVSVREYAGTLVDDILARPEADEKIGDYIRYLRDNSLGLGEVDMVYSHGDLRKDQIFFASDGSMKVIDWECSGIFSRYFDMTQMYITEEWFYKNPAIRLESLLDLDSDRMMNSCYLYLLDLCHIPIRLNHIFTLTQFVPIIMGVEKRLKRYAFTGR